MKIKLSQAQWREIGRKAGWDEGRNPSETLHERALRLIKGHPDLEQEYAQLVSEYGEDDAFSELDYYITTKISQLTGILTDMQHS